MSTDRSNPPPAPSQTSYASALHNLSLACLVVCPLLIALPPRKFDLFTASLGTMTILSANRLHKDAYGGTSILARVSPFHDGTARDGGAGGLPTERARAVAAELKRVREETALGQRHGQGREGEGQEKGVLEKVWYGQEGEDWREKRERELKEKFEEGKGIGDVIIDQIWEVVNWGKPKEENGVEKED